MAGPFDDLTPAQRQQIRDAHARGKQKKPRDTSKGNADVQRESGSTVQGGPTE